MAFSYQPLICPGCGTGQGLKRETGEWGDSMVCRYCGVRTLIEPPEDDEKYLYFAHYENGVSELRALRFDRAAEEFREAYDLDPDRPDALWGLICAEYGIVQVKSYHDQKYNPIFCLVNYKERTPFAENEQVQQLRSCIARPCEDYEIYRDWLADVERQIQKIMEATPQPHTWKWDVFIACKISKATERFPNAEGKTPEHEEALRLHKELTERGLRVFYSEKYFVDNMGKPDSDWQIMTALLNSRQMLLVCGGAQNDEKLNTPWVRSEWMRWRSMQKQGVKREDSLIVYSISESTRSLPEGLFTGNTVYPSHRAELLRTLERNCYTDGQYDRDLQKGQELLSRSDFSEASRVFTHTAHMRPDCAEPHVYLFLCDLRVTRVSGLSEKHIEGSLESNPHYREAEARNSRAFCELFLDLKDRIQFLRDRQKDDKMAKMQEKMEELERQLQEKMKESEHQPQEKTKEPEHQPQEKTKEPERQLQEKMEELKRQLQERTKEPEHQPQEKTKEPERQPREKTEKTEREERDKKEPPAPMPIQTVRYSQGLEFKKLANGTYAVKGIGTCKDTKLVIPPTTPEGGRVTAIGACAFHECSNLTSITIPDSVTAIGYSAFSKCSSLTSVTIPDSVTTIGREAFTWCRSLTSINIPDNVTTIGEGAFKGCDGLTSVYIPRGVEKLGTYSFARCKSLRTITVDPSNKKYYSQDNCVIDKISRKLVVGLQTSHIPDGVTSIGEAAFEGCNGLTSVTIPDSVTTIEESAFRRCESLTSITIPDSVTSIGMWAFSGCGRLTSITILDSVTTIGYGAFKDCSNAKIYCAHPSKPSDWHNKWNPGNRPVVWNHKPGASAPAIKTPPQTVRYSQGLKFEKLEDGTYAVKGIGTCKDTELVIPPTTPKGGRVTVIGKSAFRECSNLTSITIPDSVTAIGAQAFLKCGNLTSINIPNNVTVIGEWAFWKCDSLTSTNIPSSVTAIGLYAFRACPNAKIYCAHPSKPSGWNTDWNPDNRPVVWNHKPGASAPATKTHPQIVRYSQGLEFKKLANGMYAVTGIGTCKDTELVIPPTTPEGGRVTAIGYEAFAWCGSLTSITIPDSVTTIGDKAFWGCGRLISITIPNSVTSIGNNAFWKCGSLPSVTIPDKVTTIGDEAFEWCGRLTSITIPTSVTTIGFHAFEGCPNVTIYCAHPSKPSGWNGYWNPDNRPVVWNHKSAVDPVDASQVDEMMTDTMAQHFVVHSDEKGGAGKMGIVNTKAISNAYLAGETVDLASLRARGLIPFDVGRIKVYAVGTLDKPLTVKADAFSLGAVKMITLTGGQAIELKKP